MQYGGSLLSKIAKNSLSEALFTILNAKNMKHAAVLLQIQKNSILEARFKSPYSNL
ncbi:MAG: hypothetical protein UX20_C0001G0015 [Candidatus Magasanikbacteria bacterium GW2011_GWC2_45_8]|uniref:Uncharacterized protein n=1 Tax=Candidatus Magasanikbacteria bacterium GW2011_GWC2_45_8 TaxID=1619050 RepID=A0A0G1Q9B6_9BACT|nr:MAG: hypothetical protein UX20_C0001G0015 [Candidatus Magasanikbacteria bacterium GW2011_GWC2_45_8]